MARSISYYSGSTGGSTTVYTVPIGRTAKIVFTYAFCTLSPDYIRVDGATFITANTSASSYGTPVSVASSFTSSLVPGEQQSIGYNNGSVSIVQSTWYLGPGTSVTADGSGGGTGWKFIAIEEY